MLLLDIDFISQPIYPLVVAATGADGAIFLILFSVASPSLLTRLKLMLSARIVLLHHQAYLDNCVCCRLYLQLAISGASCALCSSAAFKAAESSSRLSLSSL